MPLTAEQERKYFFQALQNPDDYWATERDYDDALDILVSIYGETRVKTIGLGQALEDFQEHNGLARTGDLNQETMDALYNKSVKDLGDESTAQTGKKGKGWNIFGDLLKGIEKGFDVASRFAPGKGDTTLPTKPEEEEEEKTSILIPTILGTVVVIGGVTAIGFGIRALLKRRSV